MFGLDVFWGERNEVYDGGWLLLADMMLMADKRSCGGTVLQLLQLLQTFGLPGQNFNHQTSNLSQKRVQLSLLGGGIQTRRRIHILLFLFCCIDFCWLLIGVIGMFLFATVKVKFCSTQVLARMLLCFRLEFDKLPRQHAITDAETI